MKRINLFVIFWILICTLLLILSLHYRRQSDAIVAQVEPEKVAISFQKPVKIKAIYVMPGQEVKTGELLMELERPDLLYDLDILTNQRSALLQEKMLFLDNINSQIQIAKLESLSKTKEIEQDISLLKARQQQTTDIISSMETIGGADKKRIKEQNNLTDLKIQVLEKQKNQIVTVYDQKIRQLEDRKQNEIEIYNLRLERLQKEENQLSEEKTFLKNYAPIDGTIGDVYAQAGELISPYENIISIYEKHPKMIKAYMNETNRHQLEVGDQVLVESSNRNYSIDGKVTEIGSRIISYPTRLLIDPEMKIWGQEIFIEIPSDNIFLNGEKVYVRRK